jgi:hypothetical protein
MDYGATPTKPSDERSDTLFGLEPTASRLFWIVFVTGVATFLGTLIHLNTALYTEPNVVFTFLLFGTAICLYGAVFEKGPGSSRKSVWARPLGTSCGAALILGGIFGLYCYDAYGFFAFIYNNARTYQNTVPSEPAASVADAGRMIFAEEAYVDQKAASGYAAPNGVTYCIAPVRDMVETTHIQFWAVGYDCCLWAGDFKCDDADAKDARGGIVVFDNPGIFTTSNRDYYDFARRKAEASNDLISAKKPIYVRWVKETNLNMLKDFYAWRTTGFITATTCIYAAVFSLFAHTLSNSYYKAFFRLEGF